MRTAHVRTIYWSLKAMCIVYAIELAVFFKNIRLALNLSFSIISHFLAFLNIASGIFVINYTRTRMATTPVYDENSIAQVIYCRQVKLAQVVD